MSILNTQKEKEKLGFPKDGQKVVFKNPCTVHWFYENKSLFVKKIYLL